MKRFKRVAYADLNARQKENYNFQKASSILAEYGFVTLRLSDDWNGADFIALHRDGSSLKVQLKARLTFDRKYLGSDIWICFPARGEPSVYLYPHDSFLKQIDSSRHFTKTRSWAVGGTYHFSNPAAKIIEALEPYRLTLESAAPASN